MKSSQKLFAARMTHAQIVLGLIVIKGDRKIEQETEYRRFALREAIQEIACRILFSSPRFALALF